MDDRNRDGMEGERIADVLVPVAVDTAYSYRVAPGLALSPGDVVQVPLGTGKRSAWSGR